MYVGSSCINILFFLFLSFLCKFSGDRRVGGGGEGKRKRKGKGLDE